MLPSVRTLRFISLGLVATALIIPGGPPSPASADVIISGPIDLGTAEPFAVLATSTVTNTGTSTITGNLGLSPGSAVVGFPPGILIGVEEVANGVANQAQIDASDAYDIAASLTPVETGISDLVGRTLVPGVYSGGELSLTGALYLDGDADSVWVFQASDTLTIGSSAEVSFIGEATACNVFWQVGSSGTILGGADFSGTVLAAKSITVVSGASIVGRILALDGAVTLDTNTITVSEGCDSSDTVVSISPTITSGEPSDATEGVDYSYTVTSSGTPEGEYSLDGGTLPPGLTLDPASGEISGIPTETGEWTFEIVVSNGTAPDDSVELTISVLSADAGAGGPDELPAMGFDSPWTILAGLLIVSGIALMAIPTLRRENRRTPFM